MRNELFTLPNCITLCNLACGCAATVFALSQGAAGAGGTGIGRLDVAFWLIVAAAFFDFTDGMAARLTRQYSRIGVELDSLADLVSFGMAPSAILFTVYGQAPTLWNGSAQLYDVLGWGVFAVALFSALRLAKFNVDEEQRTEFEGLPTPAAGLAIAALGAMWFETGFPAPREAILLSAGVISYFLVCRVRMFSLKFKTFGWQGNEIRYFFITLCALLVAMFGIGGIPLSVAAYILISAVHQNSLTLRRK